MPEARPLRDAEEVGNHAFVVAGEPAPGAAEARVDLVGDQQPALAVARRRSFRRKPRGGILSPPRPWMGSTSTAPTGCADSAAAPRHVVDVAVARKDRGARKARFEGLA